MSAGSRRPCGNWAGSDMEGPAIRGSAVVARTAVRRRGTVSCESPRRSSSTSNDRRGSERRSSFTTLVSASGSVWSRVRRSGSRTAFPASIPDLHPSRLAVAWARRRSDDRSKGNAGRPPFITTCGPREVVSIDRESDDRDEIMDRSGSARRSTATHRAGWLRSRSSRSEAGRCSPRRSTERFR